VADGQAAGGVGADVVALDEGAGRRAEDGGAVAGVARDDVPRRRRAAAHGDGSAARGVVHEDAAHVADPGQAVGAHADVIALDLHTVGEAVDAGPAVAGDDVAGTGRGASGPSSRSADVAVVI